ncbi:hypothetical protein [Robbsia sp. KACC 23696]|uniref:hypothetical protein n=1 Tax=Robbsia sp. KACC 23696 TaxID=3149231 RepID=UPI00325BD26C
MESKKPKKTVIGGVELPQALILRRRKASTVREPGDDVVAIDGNEVIRRRRKLAGDKTLSSHYTTSLLRPVVHAYLRLKKQTAERAKAKGLSPTTQPYNKFYREQLESHPLSLYGEKLTYGNAFKGSKLAPASKECIFHGSGSMQIESENIVITDDEKWPEAYKSTVKLPLIVTIARRLPEGSPTSHERSLRDLEELAQGGASVRWWAYGIPKWTENRFELFIESLDHIFCEDPRRPLKLDTIPES